MNAEWKTFLKEQGAEFNTPDEITTFGNAELERYLIKHGPVLVSMAQQALIKVSGEDAFEFLQGQFSNDLKEVTDTQAQLTAYCDPQGKVLALITLCKVQNTFYLSFDASLLETILKRLNMFKMRSKVDIKSVGDELIQIGYAGEFADLDLQRLLSSKIKDIYDVATLKHEQATEVVALKKPGPYHRYEMFGPLEQIKVVWNLLKGYAEATNNADWRLLNIVSGQPEVTQATANEFVAQFLNLEKLKAISFKKGCFPGQEIIARMHYRGKATKRMMRLHLQSPLNLTAGNQFVLKDDADKKYKFTTILANPDIYEGEVVLAVATLKPLESITGDLHTEQGATATIEPMPYDLTEE